MLNTVTAETKFVPLESAASDDVDDGFEEAPARQTRSANPCVSVPSLAPMPVPNAHPRRKRATTSTNATKKRPRGATQTNTARPKRKRDPNWLQKQRDDFEDRQAQSEYSRK